MKSLPKLLAAVVLCQIVGLSSTPFTISSIPTWYATLIKPGFTPPNWIFGPVWTLLYAMMGVALYIVWTTKTKQDKSAAYLAFYTQLILNFFWSYIFFSLHYKFAALVEILLLWGFIAYTIMQFRAISKLAGNLLIPYLLWVSFATYLTASIWYLNP